MELFPNRLYLQIFILIINKWLNKYNCCTEVFDVSVAVTGRREQLLTALLQLLQDMASSLLVRENKGTILSTTSIFHLELNNIYLKPNFEYVTLGQAGQSHVFGMYLCTVSKVKPCQLWTGISFKEATQHSLKYLVLQLFCFFSRIYKEFLSIITNFK